MPLDIADRSIRSAYQALTRTMGTRAAGLDDLIDVLAAIGDKSGLSATDAKTQLKAAVSKIEQLAIVREGLSAAEKKDLAAILDSGTVKLTDEAKTLLEQLVDRRPVNPQTGNIDITSMKVVGGKVEISGKAPKNVTIEMINLSTAPTMRLHDDNTFALDKSDSDGAFKGSAKVSAGDWLRMRTRDADGKESDWVMIRADSLGSDKRGAEVALKRMELSVGDDGKVQVANNNNSRPLSEPFAKLQFINQRTKEKTVIDLDDTGRLPGVPKLNGKAGDLFDVSVTDGRVNTDFKKLAGVSQVLGGDTGNTGAKITDPLPHKDDLRPDGKSRYDLKAYTGPLFKDGAKPNDVMQGNIGDCYLPAAAASLAHARPDLLTQIIRVATDADRKLVNKDRVKRGETEIPGNSKFYVVEFAYDRDGVYGKHLEAVDAELYSRSYGGPLYGASTNDDTEGKMELWWPLFEKAYAQLCGGYHPIGEGGSSADVFEAVMGRDIVDEDFSPNSRDAGFRIMQDKLKKKLPVAMGTHKDTRKNEATFANSGVYGDHTYSVLDAFEKSGVKYVTLRNPWAESEPNGNGRNDGVFNLKLDDMPKWFSSVWSVE